MKHFFSTIKRVMALISLVGAATVTYAQEQSTLVLWHPNGTQTRIALYKKPQITFDSENVNITSPVLSLQYPSTNVLKFTYEGTSSGISASKGDASYRQEGERIYFDKRINSDKVALYTSGGVRVPIQLQKTERGLNLSLSSIPSGVYLLSINGKTSKIVKP